MRNGYLLAEENPIKLMEGYQLTSLEDVFLKLCIKQNNQVNQLALHFKVEIDFKNNFIGCITQWIIQ